MTYAFDEGPTDSMLANKILAALADALTPEEMGKVVAMMKDADMIDGSDIQAIEGVLNPDAGGNLAQDSRRPRLALDAHYEGKRRHVIDSVNNRFAKFAAGQIREEDLWRPYSPPPPSEEQRKAFDEMYSHYRRIG